MAGDSDVDGTIVIEVGENRSFRFVRASKSSRLGPFGEGLVAVVAPENVGRTAGIERGAGQKQIKVAVMVVVDKRDPGGAVLRRKACFSSHVLKLAVSEVAKEKNRIIERHSEVVEAVAIVVADSAGHSAARSLQTRCRCIRIFKASVSLGMEHANRLWPILHQHEVHAAIA